MQRLWYSLREPMFRSAFYRWLLPGRVAGAPGPAISSDIWPGNAERGSAIIQGIFALGGQTIRDPVPIWDPVGATDPWREAAHSFDWLRDLRACQRRKRSPRRPRTGGPLDRRKQPVEPPGLAAGCYPAAPRRLDPALRFPRRRRRCDVPRPAAGEHCAAGKPPVPGAAGRALRQRPAVRHRRADPCRPRHAPRRPLAAARRYPAVP